jgi:hypothetical protein
MAKYTIKDFKIGDKVYHLSNTQLKMVAVEIHNDLNEISCRWVDKNGQVQCIEFMPEELGKASDLAPRISVI